MPSNSANSSLLNDVVRLVLGLRNSVVRIEPGRNVSCTGTTGAHFLDARQIGRRARDFLQHAGVAEKFLQLLAQFGFFRFRLPVRFHAARFSG